MKLDFLLDQMHFAPFVAFLRENIREYTMSRILDSNIIQLEVSPKMVLAIVQGTEQYKVSIKYEKDKVIDVNCTCPYNHGGACKHIAHTIYKADTEVQSLHNNEFNIKPEEKQKFTLRREKDICKIEGLNLRNIQPLQIYELGKTGYRTLPYYSTTDWVNVKIFKNGFKGEFYTLNYKLEISFFQEDESAVISCSCGAMENNLCKHAMEILTKTDQKLFDFVFNEEAQNKKLLKHAETLGLKTSTEKLREFIDLAIINNSLEMLSKKAILRLKDEKLKQLTENIIPNLQLPWNEEIKETKEIVVLSFDKYSMSFGIGFCSANLSKNGKLKSPIVTYTTAQLLSRAKDFETFKFYNGIVAWRNLMYENSWVRETNEQTNRDRWEAALSIAENPLNFSTYFFKIDGGKMTAQKLNEIKFTKVSAQVKLSIRKDDEFYLISGKFLFDGKNVSTSSLRFFNEVITKHLDQYYVFDNYGVINICRFLQHYDHKLFVHESQFEEFTNKFINPLEDAVEIEHHYLRNARKADYKLIKESQKLTKVVYLSENKEYILLTPAVKYGEVELPLFSKRNLRFLLPDGNMIQAERDEFEELGFKKLMTTLHAAFSDDDGSEFKYLTRQEFLNDGWFLDAFAKLKADNVEILGFSELNKQNYNSNIPEVKIKVSSGIEWFDVRTKVVFGENEVRLYDLKKAVLNRQKYIPLDDGTLGILPNEWMEKFGAYFRSSEIVDGALQVHKSQFQLIDTLFSDEIEDEGIRMEIQLLLDKMKHFKSIEKTRVPISLNAELRDYQKEGLNWLNFLDEFGFGGCLADDMGLGKTIQIIAYLLLQLEKGRAKPNLIVLPTSLLFNWKSELAKFAAIKLFRTVWR